MFKDVHDLNERLYDTSDEFERVHEQGMLHAWSLPSRAIDFIKSCFKGECDTSIFKAGQSDSLYTVIPCTSDTLPALQNNTEEAHTNFSKAVFRAWDELFDSSSDQLGILAYRDHSFLFYRDQ